MGVEGAGYWTRRINRRQTLRGAALGAAGLVVIGVACGSASKKSAATTGASGTAPQPAGGTAAAKQPKRGGTFIHAGGAAGSIDIAGRGFDPAINPATSTVSFRLMYSGLLDYDPRTYAVQPEVAQKWEQPSQTEYVFTLQPNIKWQNKPPADGRTLTVDDVVFNLNRGQSNNPLFQYRSLFTTVDKIEAVDKGTVRIATKTADASMLSKLTSDGLLLLAPEVVQKFDKLTTADTAIGTGPFTMKSEQDNVASEYVRNPDYWKPGLPYLDAVRTQQMSDEQAAYAAFQAGQLDVARLNGQLVKDYTAKQGAGFTPDWFKDTGMIFANPNLKQKPLDDARITRALRLLIDHNEFKTGWAEVWFGRGRHGSAFTTALDDWDLTEAEYGQHLFWKQPKDDAIKEALSLLSAAGYNSNNVLSFDVVGNAGINFTTAASELLQAQWQKNSQKVVSTRIRELDLPTVSAVQANGQFTYGVWGGGAAATEPDAWLSQLYYTNGSRNRGGYSDAKMDALIDKQRTLFDTAQRKAVIKEAITYLADNGPNVIVSNRYYLNAVKPRVQNYAPEFYLIGHEYETVWLDT